jgi:hypothetical protein
MEFIAVVMGLGCLGYLGVRNQKVKIIGDNMSSLAWSVRSSFKDGPSRSAAMCLVALSIHLGIDIVDGEHIAGIKNIVCDGLSRDRYPQDFGFMERDCIEVDNDRGLSQLLRRCNPLLETNSDEGFLRAWLESQRLQEAFC